MIYSIDAGLHYWKSFNFDRAMRLISVMRKSDIEAGFVKGGIGIYPANHQQVDLMKIICVNYGLHVHKGHVRIKEENKENGLKEKQ